MKIPPISPKALSKEYGQRTNKKKQFNLPNLISTSANGKIKTNETKKKVLKITYKASKYIKKLVNWINTQNCDRINHNESDELLTIKSSFALNKLSTISSTKFKSAYCSCLVPRCCNPRRCNNFGCSCCGCCTLCG